ncbi:MAG: O-antigen ligase family protein [Roseiflexus sp.]|nr:O-antigen ligase family protein [Roseiflexus sp.]MCS7288340.1 O-antigen ligase family protein [Roseiflexus sp.]MDW8148953.1 O-antigen ligase family protein [Roseiflexaceae bacterium]MDW8233387.1 O-antigen ligase family protein [Roseiflexaceae bacterium]
MKQRLHSIPFLRPLILFVVGGVLGTLVAYDPELSLAWLLPMMAGAAWYLGIVTVLRHRLTMIAAVLALWGSGYGVLLATQYRYLGFSEKLRLAAWLGRLLSAPFPDMTPMFIDANAAASFLAPTAPLVIGLTWTARGVSRAAWSVAGAVVTLGLMLTSSRGAFVALAVAGILWLLVRVRAHLRQSGAHMLRFDWRRAIIPSIAVTGAVAGSALLIRHPLAQDALAAAMLRAADRLAVYRNSLFLALDFPFSGIGPGAVFGQMYSRFQLLILPTYIGYAHNLFLGVWLAQGIIGLIGFLWLLIASLRRIAPTLHTQPLIGQSAAIGCLVILLHGLTDAPQYATSWATMILAFGLFGITVAICCPADASRHTIGQTPQRRASHALGVIAAGIIALMVSAPHLAAAGASNLAAWLQARAMLTEGLTREKRAALVDGAVAWVNHGLRIAPDSPLVQKRLGMLALELGDYPRAIRALERAQTVFAADQATRKAIGLAYVWNGNPDRGAEILAQLDYADEVREELGVWVSAWRDRGRDDLAAYARRAAQLMASSR